MASKVALPIARLRALGVKVGTVCYDHEPRRGQWHYGITLPASTDVALTAAISADAVSQLGRADIRKAPADDRLIVKATSELQSVHSREAAERDVAALLSALADVLNERKI